MNTSVSTPVPIVLTPGVAQSLQFTIGGVEVTVSITVTAKPGFSADASVTADSGDPV